ncbi:MAG: glycosyltransferase [Actinomycetota bacterium]|nr:glycosyltransferase [Actinomycetota bacterium]
MAREQAAKPFLLAIFFVSYIFYLGWRALYTLPLKYDPLSIFFGLLLFWAEFVGFIESIMFYLTIKNTSTPTTPGAHVGEFPDVDVFVATYNEPPDLLYKTIVGCKNMEYPDQTKVHIYICDDGNRSEIADLCQRMGVGYITRTVNTHAKAGNLNNALTKTTSPYIVTFDADMIPMHDFLKKTMPFFLTEEPIGFVQIPQNFYNPDPFQYNLFSENHIPNEQQLFSRLIQAGRSNYNAAIYAGSNTVISRQALADIGGFVVGTITEDFATGMLIQSRGYKCIYLNEVHASGLSPESLEGLYNQRIRWGRGVVQTFKAFNPFFMKGLDLKQKMMYFSALSYWYFGVWRFIFLCSPILYSLFGIVVLSASALSVLLIWGPMFILTHIVFKLFTENIRTTNWSHIYDTILFPHVAKGVILETIGFKMVNFKVTPKDNITRTRFSNKFNLVRVQIVLAALSSIGIVKITMQWVTTGFLSSYVIILFWLSYNLYLLAMAIFFASERPKFRSAERMPISAGAKIGHAGKVFWGTTDDISETGVTIIFDRPIYLDPDSIHVVGIKTQRYSAKFSTKIVHVDNFEQKYKYAFRIVHIDESDFQQLLLILYDRVPLAPQKTQKDSVFYLNLMKNFKGRRKHVLAMNRKLPRIAVDKTFLAYGDGAPVSVHIHDFNYEFCVVSSAREYKSMTIPLSFDGGLALECALNLELSNRNPRGILIYEITNYRELVNNSELIDLLTADKQTALAV